MPRLTRLAACWSVAALAASPALAQVLPQPRLTPADPVVDDVNPLSATLRTLELGLQQPIEFNHVYRMKGLDDQFVRVHGGLYAVFPHSVYAPSKVGAIPLIPAGTVFHIGDPTGETSRPTIGPLESSPTITAVPMAMRLDTRLIVEPEPPPDGSASTPRDRRAADAPETRRVAIGPEPPSAPPLNAPGTIFGDDAYRGGRVLELLARAVDAELAAAPDSR